MANSALTLTTASKFLAQDRTVQNVYNTTAEITVATITVPAGAVVPGSRIRLKFYTNSVQNAVAVGYYYRLYVAGHLPLTATLTTIVSASRAVVEVTYELVFFAINDIMCYGWWLQSYPQATIGQGDLSSFAQSLNQFQGLARITADFTGGGVITVSVQANQLRTDSDHQIWGWTAEHITP